jgi:hypothetical protein
VSSGFPSPNPLVLSDYLAAAMTGARYEEFSDGSIGGEIPSCAGVVAFAASQVECEKELRSVLEGWVLLGLQLGHELPVVRGIDLNRPAAVAAARA